MVQLKLRFKREDGTEFPEWEENKIVDITSKIFDIDHYMPKSVTNGVPYIMTSDLVGHSNRIDFDNCKKVSYEDYCKLSKKGKTEKGDIIFARYATIGTVRLVETDRDFLVSYSCVTIKALKSKLFNDFLYQYFCSSQFEKEIKTKINTGTQGNIGIDILNQHKLLLPCLEEQQKIADFLSTVDEVIVQSEEEVQNLEQQKKAAMQKIFSQEVRFRREDGTEFPEWEDCVLSDYCKELKVTIDPKKRPNDSFLEYSMPAFDLNKKPNKVIGNDMNSSRKIINTCCVLINKLNVRKKRVWKITNPEDNSVCSAEFIPVTSDKISLDYLEYLALSDRFTARLLDCSTGTSNSQKRVTPDIIMDMPVSIACLEEQQKIADFLSAYDEAIACAKQEHDKWKELKKGLLQQMFV